MAGSVKRRYGASGAVALAAPVRPQLSVDDLCDLSEKLAGLVAAIRYHDPAVQEPDAHAAALVVRLTLAADDLLTLAAALAADPAPYLDVRELVGLLPGGADHLALYRVG